MDLIITYKSRFRLWIVWIFLVICLFCSFAHSWRISQKCPHGHYYNDGCTACWCDVQSGLTKCEPLSKCARRSHVKCPSGRRYKDSCGNDCVCYEATGAVLCNERQKCRQDVPAKLHMTPTPSSVDHNFLRRGGLAASYIPPIEEYPIRLRPPGTTPSPHRSPSTITTSRYRNTIFYENAAIESTPHPHVRIPSSGKSEELIIEPAIIIRKKGSNKASIVRNPSSATSVTLPSSRNRHRDHDLILNKSDADKPSNSASSRSASLAPLHLYEKQLQAIMNIRRAYSQLLRSKVNFNFQIATGKVPSSITGISSSTDHPRRFDSDYENSTFLTNTTPSPPMFITNQQPKPPPDNVQVKPFQPLIWRKEIKNVLKQFSPVPPLKQLVSYVATSTENYLRDFLNRNRLQQPIQMFQETTTLPPPPPEPPTVPPPYTTPQPEHSYPFPSFSTIQPFHDHQFDPNPMPGHDHQFDPNTMPVHEVYQNHDFKMLASTSNPLPQSYPPHNSYLHKTLGSQSHDPFIPNEHNLKGEQFPFMNDLLREIARIDNVPTPTPKSAPSLTAVPTFSTPGPPYAAIEEVRPLSFLPPPQPEPATPTRRTFTNRHEHTSPNLYQQHRHPTVRVNLDKPIYINSPPQQTQHRFPPPPQHQNNQQNFHHPPQHPNNQQNFHHPPQHPNNQKNVHHPPQHHYPMPQQRFPPPPQPQPILPQQTNRRVYSIPHRPYMFAPPPLQQPHQFSQPIQRQHINPQHNVQYRPIFPQFFIPKPKQYRLVLKGNVRDAAVRVDDVVPRFVSKIAHEFFKKPEIYIPKIRPGKPLTLEKVVLNHKAIVPTAMSFSPTPGVPPTKLRFTPEAQWEMKEEMAKQGIMIDEPLTPLRDYVANDPTVMEMDAPMKAVQTWETHSPMGMGTFTDQGSTSLSSIPQIIQQASTQQQQQQLYNPILLPSPTPPQMTMPPPTLDYQHQQELQHQLMLAQQEQQRQQNTATSLISSTLNNDFKIDYGDFNDFKHDGQGSQHVFPQELQLPGVEQVVVDKYLVQDPSGGVQMYTTTTIQPPTINANTDVDISSILTQHQRNGLAALPAHGPTPPPSVLVRHHGAPSPMTTPSPPPTQTPPIHAASYPTENFLVTVINSTPHPFVTTTIAPIENPPSSVQINVANKEMVSQPGGSSIISQIQDFLAEEMDFGARPHMNVYDMLFQQRTGEFANTENSDQDKNVNTYGGDAETRENDEQREDQIATETKASGEDPDPNVDTDKLANIFSIDYKNKHNNKKPPAVIVIKVPPDHSDGPFPKVVEKRRGEEIEIQGGPINSKSKPVSSKSSSTETSTEKAMSTSTPKSVESLENNSDDNDESSSSREDSSSAKRRRNKKNRKRKRRRRKKKNRSKQRKNEDLEDDKEDQEDDNTTVDKEPTTDRTKDVEKGKDENPETTTLTPKPSIDESKPEVAAEEKFQAELDWKSQLMANICDLNPSSPLCLTYRSICLLMTSDE